MYMWLEGYGRKKCIDAISHFGYERVFLRLHTVNNRKNNIKKGGVDLKMLFK